MGSEKADQKSFGIVMFKVSGILPIRALFLSHVAFRFPKYSSSNTKQMLNLLPLQEREKKSYNHCLCLSVHDEGNDKAYISYLAIMGISRN